MKTEIVMFQFMMPSRLVVGMTSKLRRLQPKAEYILSVTEDVCVAVMLLTFILVVPS